MAGTACKIIINNGVGGLSASLEKVLTSPYVRGVMISEKKCANYIQRLANIDLATYDPQTNVMPEGGLCGMLEDLYADGVFTAEIWAVFTRNTPGTTSLYYKETI